MLLSRRAEFIFRLLILSSTVNLIIAGHGITFTIFIGDSVTVVMVSRELHQSADPEASLEHDPNEQPLILERTIPALVESERILTLLNCQLLGKVGDSVKALASSPIRIHHRMPYGVCYTYLIILSKQLYHFKDYLGNRVRVNPRHFMEDVGVFRLLQGLLP